MRSKYSEYFKSERLIHSFKTALAMLIGFLLTKLIGFPADQWIVITISIVMCAQIYVGSVIQKSYLRFLGTFLGCLFTIIPIAVFGESMASIAVTLCLSGFIFSYIATIREDWNYAATLGVATTAIIMMGDKTSLFFAGARFFEITIGILIAAVISQFFLPIHARNHLKRLQAQTLDHLRQHYIACMTLIGEERSTGEERDEMIVKLLSKQRQLAKESEREPLGEKFNQQLFMKSLQCEKEILRSIDFMHRALTILHSQQFEAINSDIFKKFNSDVTHLLTLLQESQEKNQKFTGSSIEMPNLSQFKIEIDKKEYNTKTLTYVNGFLFACEMLIISLRKLAIIYKIEVDPLKSAS